MAFFWGCLDIEIGNSGKASVDGSFGSNLSKGRRDVSPSLVAMDTSRCLKLVLPFLDAVELVRAAACWKDIQSLTQQPELWEALCRSYTADCWETQRGDQVEAPEREADESGRQYFERLYERYIYFRDKDTGFEDHLNR
jgi:hypothetical protein